MNRVRRSLLVAVALVAMLVAGCSSPHRATPPEPSTPKASTPKTTATAPAAAAQPKKLGFVSEPGTNMLSGVVSYAGCNSTGWTFTDGVAGDYQPGAIDPSVNRPGSTCGSIVLPHSYDCPITPDPISGYQQGLANSGKGCSFGGSGALTARIAVTPGAEYTIQAWMLAERAPKGEAEFDIDGWRADGSPYNPGCPSCSPPIAPNSNFAGPPVNVSKAGEWQEVLIQFRVPNGVTQISFYIVRYQASTSPISKLWFDDFKLAPGYWTSTPPTPKKQIDTYNVRTTPNGSFQLRRTDGSWDNVFPFAMYPKSRPWQQYCDHGWDVIWSTNSESYGKALGPRTIGTTYYPEFDSKPWVTINFNPAGSYPPAYARRTVNAEFCPDGMRVMMDVNEAIRGSGSGFTGAGAGSFKWDDWLHYQIRNGVRNLQQNLSPEGLPWSRWVMAGLHDAEDNYDKMQRSQAVLDELNAYNTVAGVRQFPIITNAGYPGSMRRYYNAAGASFTDYVGFYSSTDGHLESGLKQPNLDIYPGYCQLSSGSGWAFRYNLYHCFAMGGHMVAFWGDDGGAAYGSYPLDAQRPDGSYYEPWWPNDSIKLKREAESLWTILDTPAMPADWSVTSNNANVDAWQRTGPDGTPYVIVANRAQTSSQTATLTFSGLSGTPTAVKNYFDGTTTLGTVSSNQVTLTLPALNDTAVNGVGGGTLVLKVIGAVAVTPTTTSTIPGATTTTTTTTSTTTTTIPGATTTTTIPTTTTTSIPASVFDDANGAWTYSPNTGNETSGWHRYGPGDPTSVGDLANGNTVSGAAGSVATFTCPSACTRLRVYGATGTASGRMNVAVDGTLVASNVELYAAGYDTDTHRHQLIWTSDPLTYATHTVTFTVASTHHASMIGSYPWVVIDAAEMESVVPPPSMEHLYSVSLPTPGATVNIGSTYAVSTGARVEISCNGTIPGVWWYRTATDTGVNTAALYSSAGSLLASGSASGVDPGPGWRYIAFSSPVAVSAGQAVIVTVWHPNGAYGVKNNGFTSTSKASPSGCMTAPASSPSLKNGLYAYASSAVVPTLTYLDGEYYVSPAFTAASGVTTTTVATTTTTTAPGSTTTTTTAPGSTTTTTAGGTTTTASGTTTTTAVGARNVTVTLFRDVNHNGVKDAGETVGLANARVRVQDPKGRSVASYTAGASQTLFVPVPAGAGYKLLFIPPAGRVAYTAALYSVPSSGASSTSFGAA